jgi:hypothetical protein
MEYSPGCAIPYVARVDAGTIELVRQAGADVVSSGDLIQRFSTIWDAGTIATHRQASDKLYRVKDRAFEAVARRLHDGTPTTEYDVSTVDGGLVPRGRAGQRRRAERFGGGELGQSALPSDGERPSRDSRGRDSVARPLGEARSTRRSDLLTLRGWDTPAARCRAFRTGVRRDPRRAGRGIHLVQDAMRAGRDLRGFEVDRAASAVLREAGYADNILHRTGHSLGETVHGNGVNMDDYETQTIAGCSRAPASRSNRGSTSTTSASGRRSTWSSAARERR